jgi:hypothetical protein
VDFFSEYANKLSSTISAQKRIIMCTDDALYFLSENLAVLIRIPLVDIQIVTLIKKNSSIIAFHCPNSFDQLLEILRRTELVYFLLHVFDKQNIKRFDLCYSDGLKIVTPDSEKVVMFDPDQ